MRKNVVLLFCIMLCMAAAAQTKRVIGPSDIYRVQNISDVQPSPDGQWVAYVVTTTDTAKDKHRSATWMVSWDGKQQVQLTGSNASSPKWSPDGKYISFVSSLARSGEEGSDDDKDAQIFLLDRRGGE